MFGLAEAEWRRGEIEQQLGAQRLQGFDRVRTLQALAGDVRFHPEVFADGQAQAPVPAIQAELQQAGLAGGSEVTTLIKDVVARQQVLAGHHPPLAALDQGHGVVQVGKVSIGARLHDPQQQRQGWIEASAQLIQQALLPLHQGRSQQQITGRIAPEHQLGPDQ